MGELQLLTPESLANLLGVSMSWIREHITAGDLPGQITLGKGKIVRFRRSDVHAALLRKSFLEPRPGAEKLPADELEGDDLRPTEDEEDQS